ncbi:MAG: M61 family metallopeptidase [Armatimonadetes bacterium]|nr:M61 family metallopeptidase [Armatimonadota bacterium]
MKTARFLRVAALAVLFLPLAAAANIFYSVTANPAQGRLEVSLTFVSRGASTELQIPRWRPGSYRLAEYDRNIKAFEATDPTGRPLITRQVEDTTWRVSHPEGIPVRIQYEVPATVRDGVVHYSGPGTYLYVVGRKDEGCVLRIETPPDWRVVTGLDRSVSSGNTFIAPSYDVLADNPVTMGDFLMDKYEVLGKPHFIAMRGPGREDVDRPYLVSVCKSITEAQADFFGGLPYSKFVWHFNVSDAVDGGGGLEHLSSTQISLGSGVGPRSIGVLAHEFFHLWNVKRIRSKPLGPFNYQELPETGALWWLEGVTDYYADLLLFRYGDIDENAFLASIASTVRGVRSNSARMEVSPHEASWKVRDAADGRGNSRGWRISYYNTGWLVGMCLDIELRARTGGERSLDDVMLALWEICRDDKPGFEEDDIRKQLMRFGGEEMGEFYDRVVMTAGELPAEEQLAKIGLRLIEEEEAYADVGFRWVADKGKQGARVIRVSGPAEGKLERDDVIVAINTQPIVKATNREITVVMNEELAKAEAGVVLYVRVKREDKEEDIEIRPLVATRTVRRVEALEDATDAQKALRRGWYYADVKDRSLSRTG